ncbi:MAG: heme-binding protein [Acidobacteria bacterium]|nr:heme-binding protein [Acidobacteriota bacterium]
MTKGAMLILLIGLGMPAFCDDDDDSNRAACQDLPSHAALRSALSTVVTVGGNGGLAFHMWATVVNRDGVVCAVVFTGSNRGAQWPGSRVISAQKANTANAFSLPAFALSTANLHAATQPGGSLFGLQHSNPVNTEAAYGGNASNYGQPNDPLTGDKIGGVNVFGGGLALYRPNGTLVGAVGVSGDTSCTDHIVAWKVRHRLNLDSVPGGVGAGNTDNIIHDYAPNINGNPVSSSAGGFGHPTCGAGAPATAIANNLPLTHPVGPAQ